MGLILIQLLQNGLALSDVTSDSTVVVIGTVLILAVLINLFIQRRRGTAASGRSCYRNWKKTPWSPLSDPVTAHPEVKPSRCGKFARNRPSRKDNKKFALYWARIAYPLYSEEQAHGVTFKSKRNSLPRYCPSRVL